MARASRSESARQAVIGRSTQVRGRISGDGDLVIEGTVEGDIALKGALTIGDGAEVTSNVDAEEVTIAGALEGDVHARGDVRIASGGRVRGNMFGQSVALEEGAEFAGRLDCAFELPAELGGTTTTRRK